MSALPPRRPVPRITVVITVIAVVFALIYLAVVVSYAATDRAAGQTGCTGEAPDDAILVSLTPTAVDAINDRIGVLLDVQSFGPAGDPDSGLPTQDLTVFVSDVDGPRTFTFSAEQPPSPISAKLISDGVVERWPFDSHAVRFGIIAATGVGTAAAQSVPVQLCGSAHVPGWSIGAEEASGDDELVVDGESVTQISLVATRSIATVAFGMVLLALMTVLPLLGLTVAVLVLLGERKVEATLTSWMAAMLFAIIPLRTFLPGSPPIGSWVDYLVVLWVVAGLVVALAVYVIAWIRWTPRGGRPPAS